MDGVKEKEKSGRGEVGEEAREAGAGREEGNGERSLAKAASAVG